METAYTINYGTNGEYFYPGSAFSREPESIIIDIYNPDPCRFPPFLPPMSWCVIWVWNAQISKFERMLKFLKETEVSFKYAVVESKRLYEEILSTIKPVVEEAFNRYEGEPRMFLTEKFLRLIVSKNSFERAKRQLFESLTDFIEDYGDDY